MLAGPEGEHTVRARYLVGCDSAHSSVRKALGRRISASLTCINRAIAGTGWHCVETITTIAPHPDRLVARFRELLSRRPSSGITSRTNTSGSWRPHQPSGASPVAGARSTRHPDTEATLLTDALASEQQNSPGELQILVLGRNPRTRGCTCAANSRQVVAAPTLSWLGWASLS
ncbi:FAD-dependent monooxygenase [Nocardia alba]|uniref:FAD-dependent monooxygenase n=1 Tax=Nocardia alba TaxID=225051 RepID=UPI003531505D